MITPRGAIGYLCRLCVTFTVGLTLLLLVCDARAEALRIACYNMQNNPDEATEDSWFRTVFSAMGQESINGLARPLDLLCMEETDTAGGPRTRDVLNNLYGVSTYQVLTSTSVGGDKTGVVYNSANVTMLDWADLNSIGLTHPILRAHFQLASSTDPNTEFYLYAVHLKSGSDSAAKDKRAAEATTLRNDILALGAGKNFILAGDFNMDGSSEGAWTYFTAAGSGQLLDVANSPGEWTDNEAFKTLDSYGTTASVGGMDNRFELQMVTASLFDGVGLDYSGRSYHVFANNGTHTLNGAISTGTGASPTVLSALESASDHLPAVADYIVVPEPSSVAFLTNGLLTAICLWRLRARK